LNESVATRGGEGVKISALLTEYDQSLTTMLEGQVFTVTGTLDPTDSQPSRGKLYWYVVEDGGNPRGNRPNRGSDSIRTKIVELLQAIEL
jgi:hypothetical protein